MTILNTQTKDKSISACIARYRLIWLLLVASIGIVADQGSKIWAQENLAKKWETTQNVEVDGVMQTIPVTRYVPFKEIVVVENIFNLIYRENPAAAFSITSSLPEWFRRPLLLILSIFATLLFVIWYSRLKVQDAILMTSFCLIIAGAIGNLIDRAMLGYVIDFLDVYAGFLGYPNMHWPTFNVADSCIVVGAIGILLRTLKPAKEAKTI